MLSPNRLPIAGQIVQMGRVSTTGYSVVVLDGLGEGEDLRSLRQAARPVHETGYPHESIDLLGRPARTPRFSATDRNRRFLLGLSPPESIPGKVAQSLQECMQPPEHGFCLAVSIRSLRSDDRTNRFAMIELLEQSIDRGKFALLLFVM